MNATLTDDMRLILDRYTIPAGNVHFLVTNSGGATHELVVLKTDLAADKLVANATVFGRVARAGVYMVICNEIGHFAGGMHTTLIVLPAPTGDE